MLRFNCCQGRPALQRYENNQGLILFYYFCPNLLAKENGKIIRLLV